MSREIARALFQTYDDLLRETGIRPNPDVITIRLHPTDYAVVYKDREEFGYLDPIRKNYAGFQLVVDPEIPVGQIKVILHHEIMVNL